MGATLQGQHIVVTGASSGLGWAMADALLREGAAVAIAARSGPRLEQVVNAWRHQGYQAVALPMDVRDPGSVDEGRDWIANHWPSLHMVVNNAGIGMRTVNPHFMTDPMPFFRVSPVGFTDVIATNLTGYFLVSRAFAELFLRQGHGRFVNITMNHQTMLRRGFVPYGPSRAGAESLSLIMAEDLKPYGVTVNLLLPGGATATGMIPGEVPEGVKSRLLSADIMGPPIVWLASDAAAGVTGERIEATRFAEWLQQHR